MVGREQLAAAVRQPIVDSADPRLAGVKVYPLIRGADMPAIAVRVESHEPLKMMGQATFGKAKLNLVCISRSYDETGDIADAVEEIFTDYEGVARGLGRVEIRQCGRVDYARAVADTDGAEEAEIECHTQVDVTVRRG